MNPHEANGTPPNDPPPKDPPDAKRPPTLTAPQIARVAYRAGFRGDRLTTAVAVALAESSGRVGVVNSLGCVGLWQINQPVHVKAHPNWSREWLRNADHNATAAHILSDDGVDWSPWQAYLSGAYRSHLPAARAATVHADQDTGAGPKHGDGPAKPKAGTKVSPKRPPIPKSEPDDDPRVRLGRLFTRAAKLPNDVADAVLSANLAWSTTEVTQLTLGIADPGFELYTAAHFVKGMPLLYREPGMEELRFVISAITLDGGPVGTGGMSVTCRSRVAAALKARIGPGVMRHASPTDFVRVESKAVGAKVVAQPSPSRAQVRRDVPQKGDSERGSSLPSSWTTFQRLAGELGYWVFEYADTIYFGKPTWLMDHAGAFLQVALPIAGQPAVWVTETMPSIATSDDSTDGVTIGSIQIPKQRLKEVNPGRPMRLWGLAPFDAKPYIVTSMTMSLLGPNPIELEASTPINPDPQPPQKAGGGSRSGTSSSSSAGGTPSGGGNPLDDGGGHAISQNGSRSANAFVAAALSASNARYVFGAEASVSDPSPSALDCSELIQWACGRVGLTFVDGSAAQYAASRHISVADALKTRGAILYWDQGHIGISLGDNQRSCEARNPSAGVGVFNARDIAWTGGGLIPGLQYGAGSSATSGIRGGGVPSTGGHTVGGP